MGIPNWLLKSRRHHRHHLGDDEIQKKPESTKIGEDIVAGDQDHDQGKRKNDQVQDHDQEKRKKVIEIEAVIDPKKRSQGEEEEAVGRFLRHKISIYFFK